MLELIPETIFSLSEDGKIVTWNNANPNVTEGEETVGESTERDELETGNELIAIQSDDEGTSFTLYDNGTYEFFFEAYDIRDIGTYTYDTKAQILSMIDANGKETVSSLEGNNMIFHYMYSASDQLTGDYTVAAADLAEALQKQ